MPDMERSLSKLKQQGRRLVGCFPLYPPLELFHSFGLVPLILWDMKDVVRTLKESDRHLQRYSCSVARRLIEFILSEDGSLLDGIFMYNACDTLRNLPEIIQHGLGGKTNTLPLLKLHVPMANPGQTDSSAYFTERIRKLMADIEKAYGLQFSPERFLASIKLYASIRRTSLKLERLVADGKMSYVEFSRVLRNGYLMTPEDHLSELEDALRKAESNSPGKRSDRNGIILSGILPPPEALCALIEKAGLRVAGNDVASQARSYSYVPQEIDDPIVYYADLYRNHYPCTTLLYSSDKRLNVLTGLIEKHDVRGLIFIGEKFCEYEYLEIPFITKMLEQKNIATLQLEIATDDDDHLEALKTRIEAFSELIR